MKSRKITQAMSLNSTLQVEYFHFSCIHTDQANRSSPNRPVIIHTSSHHYTPRIQAQRNETVQGNGVSRAQTKKEEKTEEKTEAPAEAGASPVPDTTEDKPEEHASEPVEATTAAQPPKEDDDEPAELIAPKASHGRKPSVAIESRQRSESFYRSGAAGTPTSPNPVTPGGGITSEVYREQAHRIEELEKENKKLAVEVEENQARWQKGEEELEELREGRGDVALAVEKGKETDKLV